MLPPTDDLSVASTIFTGEAYRFTKGVGGQRASLSLPRRSRGEFPDRVPSPESGASKSPVYDGARLEAAPPTRLFIDGQSDADWRGKGFYSVTDGAGSILLRLLDLKAAHPLARDKPLPGDIELGIRRSHLCVNADELKTVPADQPHLGMPFALPGMTTDEVARIRAWLEQGAKGIAVRLEK